MVVYNNLEISSAVFILLDHVFKNLFLGGSYYGVNPIL